MTIEGTLADLLGLLGADEIITPDIVTALQPMGGRELSELAGMSGLKLASEINLHAKGIQQPLAIANRVRQLIEESFGSGASAASSPSSIQVEVKQEKTLGQYNLGELLTALAAKPSRYTEIVPHLEREPQYAAALLKTVNLGVPTTDGRFDPDGSASYIITLARPHAKPQRMVNGRRPAPIEKLLGLEVRALIHPFTFEPIQGPDVKLPLSATPRLD